MENFKIVRTLGRGSYGVASLAQRDGELLVLKALPFQKLLKHPHAKKRAKSELHILRSLHHPHIIRLIESFIHREDTGKSLVLVLEYANGGDLQSAIDALGKKVFEPRLVLRWAHELCEALAYIHAHNVIHRDLTPANILLHDNSIKLGDFGLTRTLTGADGETAPLTLCGTPLYVSPEMASGLVHYTSKHDLFALGSVLYSVCAKVPPFVAPDVPALLDAIARKKPRPLDPRLWPDSLRHLVRVLHEKDPAKRPSASAALRLIAGVESDSDGSTSASASTIASTSDDSASSST